MNKFKKGFTLIELLVVIAVLGVLAAVLLVAINPLQKINQANDSKVKSDIGQLITAAAVFATKNGGGYPAAIADMVGPTNELPAALVPPAGYVPATYTYTAQTSGNAACTTVNKNCAKISISGQIKAPAVSTNNIWCAKTSTGIAAEGTNCVP